MVIYRNQFPSNQQSLHEHKIIMRWFCIECQEGCKIFQRHFDFSNDPQGLHFQLFQLLFVHSYPVPYRIPKCSPGKKIYEFYVHNILGYGLFILLDIYLDRNAFSTLVRIYYIIFQTHWDNTGLWPFLKLTQKNVKKINTQSSNTFRLFAPYLHIFGH